MEADSESLFTISEEGVSRSRVSSRCSFYIVGADKIRYLPSVNFIYQRLDFTDRCGEVPSFVKTNFQKSCRLSSESYILRVNYFRRRREASSDVILKGRLLDEEGRRTKLMDALQGRFAMAGPPP